MVAAPQIDNRAEKASPIRLSRHKIFLFIREPADIIPALGCIMPPWAMASFWKNFYQNPSIGGIEGGTI